MAKNLLNAADAKELTAKAQLPDAKTVRDLTKYVCAEIAKKAKLGMRVVVDPLCGVRMPITTGMRRGVKEELVRLGYTVNGDVASVNW